jgi:hypothetical protein
LEGHIRFILYICYKLVRRTLARVI